MAERCHCCKLCCYSTPYGTIFALSMTLVGLVGFISSAVYSIITAHASTLFAQLTPIFSPVLAFLTVGSLVPLIFSTVMAYCITGYVRDELYHNSIKSCVGGACTKVLMVISLVFLLIWLLVNVGLSLTTTLYFQLLWACPQFSAGTSTTTCFEYRRSNSTDVLQFCRTGFSELCDQGQKIGLVLAIALAFSLVIVIGFVTLVAVQCANYVSVRESDRRSYRPGG